MTLRIAFMLVGGTSSTGGYNYLINLIKLVDEYHRNHVACIVFVGSDQPEEVLSPFRSIYSCECVQTDLLNEQRRLRSQVCGLTWGFDPWLINLIRSHRVDLVFESAHFLGWRTGIPAIAWIPDFQHKHLPHYFSKAAWWKRELGLLAQIHSGRTVMVSSLDALGDCERFYPSARGRTHAVRFAVPPPSRISRHEARQTADRHGLPAKYFFMPNQFWAHKNHLLVLDALKILRDEMGQHVTILASGRQEDGRDPTYAPKVLAAISESGLQKYYLTPGLLPYEELRPLMLASMALINPSLFEGWSTTVEEARSTGVPMILSDLRVHQEQAGTDALYFERHNPRSLATILSSFELQNEDSFDNGQESAHSNAMIRVKRFADEFVHLCLQTIRSDS